MQLLAATFFTDTYKVTGNVLSEVPRLSDCLNDPRVGFLRIENAGWQDLSGVQPPALCAEPMIMRKDAIRIAIPQHALDPLRPRSPTDRYAATVALDMFVVRGAIHRRPSDPANLTPFFMQQTRLFVPVADGVFHCVLNDSFDGSADVLLLGAAHARYWFAKPA